MNPNTQNEWTLAEPQPLDQNAATVYLASLPAETGKRTQAQALRVIAQVLGTDLDRLNWGALRYQHTAAIRAKMAQVYKPATANKMLSALRQTLKQAWLLGQMTAEEYRRAANLKPIKGETLPAGRELSQGEILALMNTCQDDPSNAGTRDAAIIGLMYAAGLRRDEVVRLDVPDLDPETGMLVIHGKRNKERTPFITNGALEALNDWLAIRGESGSSLFVTINKGGKLDSSHGMTSQAIYNMFVKRAQEAGIKNFSPHDIRRTFISHLLDAGADIATVSKMAGHANIQTTARYDRRPEETKRTAAELLHVPYKTRKAG
ncbi:MAG TPA: tyrosine-type recombinase/integrase [Anaerolineales bacterium]|nr:tyrosine-type recombinase/integrase [Anaerolineales bacterium]